MRHTFSHFHIFMMSSTYHPGYRAALAAATSEGGGHSSSASCRSSSTYNVRYVSASGSPGSNWIRQKPYRRHIKGRPPNTHSNNKKQGTPARCRIYTPRKATAASSAATARLRRLRSREHDLPSHPLLLLLLMRTLHARFHK